MIKNSRLVFSMSLEQRIKLITSAELYKSRSLEEYGFPAMEFSANPLCNRQARATDFPSDTALACAFDDNIVSRVYDYIGSEAKAGAPFAYYDVDNLSGGEIDAFILGRVASGKVSGLNGAGTFVNYNDTTDADCTAEQRLNRKSVTDAVMKAGDPDSVVIRDTGAIGKYKKYESEGLLFGVASTKEEVARFINGGCSFVFLKSDFTDELVPYLIGLTEEFKRADGARSRGKITTEKIDYCRGELAMLPEELINEACGEIIQTLIALSNNGKDEIKETAVALGSELASFNEPLHLTGALEGARQSVVMIKNDGVLPLDYDNVVAVLGEYAKSEAYHGNGNIQTDTYLPFEVINNYDIRTAGFAYGYRNGQPFNEESWQTASTLCKKADVTLVYLCARAGEHVLPEEQLNLLSALSRIGAKTVAIVASDGKIDMGFASMCNAVLLTHRGGQKVADAVFEILTGYTPPSGKLPYSVSERVATDGTESGNILYPLGFGLTYTAFEYKHLLIDNGGVSVTVTNTGDTDGYTAALLYVQRKTAGEYDDGKRRLRGYKKIFVPGQGTEKIYIPFGEDAFRTYDPVKDEYLIEGGEYVLSVGETESDISLHGQITLNRFVYDETSADSEEKERADGRKALPEFADTKDKRAFFARRHTAPVVLRIIIAVLVAAYFDGTLALTYFGGLLPEADVTYIVIGTVLAIINLAAIIYCIIAVKRHRELVKQNVPVGEDTVSQLGDFKELAVISYEKPITPEKIEEEEEIAQEEEAVLEEEEQANIPVYTYDTGFTEIAGRKIAFKSGVSLQEICNNFHEYALSCGIEVALSSVRALFAAIASGKIILLRINHKELQPEFIKVLLGYFQCEDAVEASPEWKAPSDLYWNLKDGRYVASGFVNAVYDAHRTPDKNAVAVIGNVTSENLSLWFDDFIRFALYPSEKHIVKLNDDTQMEIPHNLCCMLVTEGDCAIARNVAAACLQVHIGISKSESAGQDGQVEVKNISCNYINDLVRDSREEYFLPEIYWKKLDELVEAINATERFGIGNKTLIQLEKFTSVLIACGADSGEAFTKMFVAKIAALLKTLSMYKAENGDKTIYGIIEKLYGDENLTKIRKALNKTAPSASDAFAKVEETVAEEHPVEEHPVEEQRQEAQPEVLAEEAEHAPAAEENDPAAEATEAQEIVPPKTTTRKRKTSTEAEGEAPKTTTRKRKTSTEAEGEAPKTTTRKRKTSSAKAENPAEPENGDAAPEQKTETPTEDI